jgi:hypothetical protein
MKATNAATSFARPYRSSGTAAFWAPAHSLDEGLRSVSCARPIPNGAHVVPGGGAARADRQGGGRGNFQRVLHDAARPRKTRGSLVVSGALACGEESEAVRRELAHLRQGVVTALQERFERAVQDGDLPARADCVTLARYAATMLNGLAFQAASGATEKELRLVAAQAMRAWPT